MQELRKEHERLMRDDALKETSAFVGKLENHHYLAEVQDFKVRIK